ncbi:MAG: hypothetical protein EP302_06280 [Bacteroidetes bacterium]|nr:MAG: hypothetical protein EP302_06280 [Bacteroidota bacterium]
MPEGHEARFEARLEQAFRQKTGRPFFWLGIAASVVALLGMAFWFFQKDPVLPVGEDALVEEQSDTISSPATLSLGDLSPDLRKLEEYYTASINLELASLNISDENREMADNFISRLSELNSEYEQLNEELNEIGPNEQTITAMIKNLQYRLQLLLKLKEKLNELKSSKNETVQASSI